jgi:uncharacterized membrane protein YfcA
MGRNTRIKKELRKCIRGDSNAIVFIVAGCASGFINTMAGSGSAITLPLLMFLGVPVSVANGTNRLPIVAGSAISVLTFNRAKVLDWKHGLWISIPFTVGALAGAELATCKWRGIGSQRGGAKGSQSIV